MIPKLTKPFLKLFNHTTPSPRASWAYPESGSKAKVHNRHYKCMNLDDICCLPVEKIANTNSALFIWVTAPRLFDAKKVISAWGFEYKTMAFVWTKKNKKNDNYFMGCGSYTRSNVEICLLGIRGSMFKKKISNSVRQICDCKIMEHSKKPDEIRNRIVELFGNLPRIELFARKKTSGWNVHGDQVEKFN